MNTPNKLTIIACAMYGLAGETPFWNVLDDAGKKPWLALAERLIQTTFGAELSGVDRAKVATQIEQFLPEAVNANAAVCVAFNVMALL